MKSTVETKIIELVKLGHELAKELHCAESAALVSDLASQLEVQLVRSNALAAENAGLKAKGRELLNEASKVYEKFNGTVDFYSGDFMDGQTLHEFQFLLDAETPATDAFLAEVRARSLDEFARAQDEQAKKYYELSPGCSGQNECQFAAGQAWYFAECIRKGVQS
ncbi:hypothetical protein [Citrobacter koseri]|uniref:hypothetical protein n=1 Tax=Citrobacter koseri TaxID=545 RepID=UPI000E16EA33|nr:hypothetical protein [Citrobacter koseri]SUX61244.1 Uncharacterised protein [Citrobacter koseri]